jgi:ABC-type multidrug transport system ATPase subunit
VYESPVELRAESLVKVLGGARVLRGVEATFAAGALHVIEGANGSGKSTLLALLGGRAEPTSGRAYLLGPGGEATGALLRKRVGWLGHELGLYPDLTAFENVALHAELRGLDGGRAWREGAAALGIEGASDRRVRELSRGQRQRVALVRALLGRPSVLLLDEPSTGLDTAATDLLLAVLTKLRDAGMVLVIVTHDAPFRDRLRGTVWKLAAGRISRADA